LMLLLFLSLSGHCYARKRLKRVVHDVPS
jgi:hypothetical protein